MLLLKKITVGLHDIIWNCLLTMTAWNNQSGSYSYQSKKAKDPELSTRTSWVDAQLAYRLVLKGQLSGKKCALLVRSHLQNHLFKLGRFEQRHCGKVLILGLLFLSLFAIGLKTSVVENDINKLWVEEDGRLPKELEYTKSMLGEGYGSENQIVIQTPGTGAKNVLTRESLLNHVEVVTRATKIEVHLFDEIWRIDDLCVKASFPSFENFLVTLLLNKLVPCVVISPLDCFWEGSKMLGPRRPLLLPASYGLEPITWKNLYPELLVNTLENNMDFDFDIVKDALRRAGLVSGYQKKPCLDPFDPECPVYSVNYRSTETVDSVAPALTGGCFGFAPEFMHWEEDMIVGGVTRNRSNVMVSAEAVQTIIQIMGEQDLYNYYKGTYLVSSIDWSQEKAAQIIEVFQKKFTEVVVSFNNQSNVTDSVSSFTQTSLDELIQEFSEISFVRIGIGYGLMLLYAILTLMNCCNPVHSHAGAGICGVVLVSLSVAAGLGLCSLLGLPFNAATTQIVPFLALGLGVDDMFLMVHTFSQICSSGYTYYQDQAGELVKRAGCTVLLTSLSNSGAFLIAALVPIPALRMFSLQVGILLLFNLITILLIFPAILSIDAWRKKNFRVDVVCCIESAPSTKVMDISALSSPSPTEDKQNTVVVSEVTTPDNIVTKLAAADYTEYEGTASYSDTGSSQNLTEASKPSTCCDNKTSSKCSALSLSWLVDQFYLPLVEKTWFKVVVFVFNTVLICVSIYGITQVKVGMELTDIVPKETNEYRFLKAQSDYFGFYDMYIVTKDNFQYQLPENQKLMRELHGKISQVSYVIQKDDGSSREFWLDLMVKWLRDLQESYENDVAAGFFHSTGWYYNASDDAVLAYKLLIQTGDTNNPLDKTQASYKRLVNDEGIIASDAFYNYLTAWVYNDVLAYEVSLASIRPEGKEWFYVPGEGDLLIPKAPSIQFARMSFFLHNLVNTEEIVKCIRTVRDICEDYEELGLDSYPSGLIFTFWEQYINIRYYLLISLVSVLASVFIIITFMMMNPLAAFLLVLTLSVITVELFGFMGLIGIQLSAVPVVILVASVGVGVEFTIHVMTSFITSIGNRQLRTKRSLSFMFAPIVHGAISTLLGIIMLAASQFDFIFRYFFLSLLALVVLGLFNGLVFFPILISVCGPSGEVEPEDLSDSSIPLTRLIITPPSSPEGHRARRRRSSTKKPLADPVVLSTITEEQSGASAASSHSSNQEICSKVTPTVNVETTITPYSKHSSTQGAQSKNGTRSFTKVKTKATVTVEVHTELPGYGGHDSPIVTKTSHSPPTQVEETNDLEGAGCVTTL